MQVEEVPHQADAARGSRAKVRAFLLGTVGGRGYSLACCARP